MPRFPAVISIPYGMREARQGAVTGPPVGQIVHDGAVHDRRAGTARELGQLPVKLALAVITAIRRVRAERRIRQLSGGHDLESSAEGSRLRARQLQLAGGVGVGAADHAQRAHAEHLVRHAQQQARVHPTRVGHDHLVQAPQQQAQALEPLGPGKAREWVGRGSSRRDA
jgi:hypothetical protein